MQNKSNNYTGLEIAVIGMAGRFPGAENVNKFWDNLKEGKESICFLNNEEISNIDKEYTSKPNYVNCRGGILENKDLFDNDFFEYSFRESEIMDPQIRLIHECSYEALEDSGYIPKLYDKKVGMFASCSDNFLWRAAQLNNKKINVDYISSRILSVRDFLPTRVAYKLNLTGPVSLIQNACSSSLMSLHLASRSILLGECTICLAAGVSLSYHGHQGYLYQEEGIASKDGHCRSFDAKASGTVRGEGVGVVVLKKLDEAIKDNDNIYAVIRSSAVNNDGARKVGYTAPSPDGQFEVIKKSLLIGNIESESVGYIEAHGSGTILGDPIEISALNKAYDKAKECAIGSVKTNIGHLDSAAGIAGFIKVVLSINNRAIPASLNFDSPNPKCKFTESPFFVNTKFRKWENEQYPLRAGVSSFGIGGTNVHMIIEESPVSIKKSESEECQILPISAKSPEALQSASENLIEFLKVNKHIKLKDVAFTLQQGREEFEYRKSIVCNSIQDALNKLNEVSNENHLQTDSHSLIFVFSGIGYQHINMGKGLYDSIPYFKEQIDKSFSILEDIGITNLKTVLFPRKENTIESGQNISDFNYAQLVLFVIEYAIAKFLIHIGIKPSALIGYSFGEYVAACIAGVMDEKDTLRMLVARAEILSNSADGLMISVPLPKDEIIPILPADTFIAIDNGLSCIVSGKMHAINELEKLLVSKKILFVYVNSNIPLHSELVSFMQEDYVGILNNIEFKKPLIPIVSNLTGDWISETSINANYWYQHSVKQVKFKNCIDEVSKLKNPLFIEIGSGNELSNLIGSNFFNGKKRPINIMKPRAIDISDYNYICKQIGKFWSRGIEIDWSKFNNDLGKRISLPTYPFNRNKFSSYEILSQESFNNLNDAKSSIKDKEININNWFYKPGWERKNKLKNKSNLFKDSNILVFGDKLDITKTIEDITGCNIYFVNIGRKFKKTGKDTYEINIKEENDYTKLFESLKEEKINIKHIIHLYGDYSETKIDYNIVNEECFFKGVYSILFITKALNRNRIFESINLKIITKNAFNILGNEEVNSYNAMILGAVKVIRQEYLNINCTLIDIDKSLKELNDNDKSGPFITELLTKQEHPVLGIRNNYCWIESFNRIELKDESESIIKRNGTYLITGGLGYIGFNFAEYIIREFDGNIILTGRRSINELNNEDSSSLNKKIEYLNSFGKGKVIYIDADVSDTERMTYAYDEGEKILGKINGVIHAAGVMKMIAINETTTEYCNQHFNPKINGVLNLSKIIESKESKPDFCIVVSSLSPVLGGLGFFAYSTSSAFVDSFSFQNKNESLRWINVNWGDWDKVVDSKKENFQGFESNLFSMSKEEGLETFKKVISEIDYDSVIISSGNLYDRYIKWVSKLKELDYQQKTSKQNVKKFDRPSLSTSYQPPNNELEIFLVNTWKDYLGLQKIGINDNFFELGLSSLDLVQLIAKVREHIKKEISLLVLFENPTINLLSKYLTTDEQVDNDQQGFTLIETQQKRADMFSRIKKIGKNE